MAVSRLEHLIRDDIGMLIAASHGFFAREKVIGSFVYQPCDLAIDQCDVDVLTFARTLLVPQGRKDRSRSIHACHHVGNADGNLCRLAIRGAGHAHDTAITLHQKIIARLISIGSGLPEPCDRTKDEAGKFIPQIVVGQSEFLQPADLEIVGQDIATSQKATHDLRHLWR